MMLAKKQVDSDKTNLKGAKIFMSKNSKEQNQKIRSMAWIDKQNEFVKTDQKLFDYYTSHSQDLKKKASEAFEEAKRLFEKSIKTQKKAETLGAVFDHASIKLEVRLKETLVHTEKVLKEKHVILQNVKTAAKKLVKSVNQHRRAEFKL